MLERKNKTSFNYLLVQAPEGIIVSSCLANNLEHAKIIFSSKYSIDCNLVTVKINEVEVLGYASGY
jgi:hypothetical protein